MVLQRTNFLSTLLVFELQLQWYVRLDFNKEITTLAVSKHCSIDKDFEDYFKLKTLTLKMGQSLWTSL